MSSSELKVLLIGESDVGKSNILLRFTQNVFSADFIPTMGTDFLSKEIQIPDKEDTVRLNIWDTAGQERFRTITSSHYRCTDCVLVVFDITNRQSFERVSLWLHEVNRFTGENLQVAIVGNKIDLEESREVTKQEAQDFAAEYGVAYHECSAKENIDISCIFTSLATKAMKEQAIVTYQPANKHSTLKLPKKQRRFSKFCSSIRSCTLKLFN